MGFLRSWAVLATLALLAAAGATVAEEPGAAFDLLQRVREAYLLADAYADEGTIAVERDGEPVERWTFRTWASRDGRFELVLTPEGGGEDDRIVLGRAGRDSAAFRVSPGSTAQEPQPAFDRALATLFGEGTADATAVPALLALGARGLADPDALALDGEEACGAATCEVLTGSRDGGAVSFSYWAERDSARLRRIEVHIDDLLGRRAVRVAIEPRDDRLVEPSALLRAAAGEPAAPAPAAEGSGADQETPTETFRGEIEVALVTLEVRAVDLAGAALRDLAVDDFRIRAARTELPAASVDWVDPRQPLGEEPDWEALAESGTSLPVPGRVVVFFVQADLHESRALGQMKLLPKARELVGTLGPDDLAAVVSFDSQLRLQQDLTDDRERIRDALERSIRPGPAPGLRARRGPSLFAGIDPRQARRAAGAEKGLALVGHALESLERQKIVVYLGFGFGELTPSGVHLPPAYREAVAALDRAHASVFVLDITEADFHSLEVGIQKLAADTGGTYAKTYQFGQLAVDRLASAITGHYLLTVEVPQALRDAPLRVELRDRRRGSVLLLHSPPGVQVEAR